MGRSRFALLAAAGAVVVHGELLVMHQHSARSRIRLRIARVCRCVAAAACPCSNPAWCSAIVNKPAKEILAFHVTGNGGVWSQVSMPVAWWCRVCPALTPTICMVRRRSLTGPS
jgi:hypothetical protein